MQTRRFFLASLSLLLLSSALLAGCRGDNPMERRHHQERLEKNQAAQQDAAPAETPAEAPANP